MYHLKKSRSTFHHTNRHMGMTKLVDFKRNKHNAL